MGTHRGSNLRRRVGGKLVSDYLPPGPVPARWNDLFAGYHLEEALGADRADVLGARDLNDVINDVQQTGAVIGNGALLTTSGSELNRVTSEWAFTGDWTVCLWIKNITGWSPFGDEWLGSIGPAGHDWRLYSGSSQLYAQAMDTNGSNNSSCIFTPFVPSNNTWYFIAFTYDSAGKALRGSVNGGNFLQGGTLPNGMRTQGTQCRMRNVPPNAIPWAADELYFFTAKKSDAWMTDMYDGGAGRAYPG